jgi:copper transport protein
VKRLVLTVACLTALALPVTASAHTTLESAAPATQTRVERPPAEVVLRFNESVVVARNAIQVLGTDGRVLSGAVTVSPDGRTLRAPVAGARVGEAYTVRWRVTGRDGHSPAGVYTFGVGVEAPPPTEAVGSSGTTWKDHLARWLLFAALALVIGPLVLRLVVLRGEVPARLERRVHLVTILATFAVIDVGIAAFVIRASNALQLPLSDLPFADLQPFAEQTRFGVAFLVMTVGFATVAALLALAWAFDRLELRWPALGLSLVLVSGLSFSGHQATATNSTWLSEVADWLHLVAASIWVGGLVTLALLVWPAAPKLRARAFLGFSRIAVALVAAMVLAGAYLALVRLPDLASLWETDYGRTLALKLAVVAVALSWGGFHHLFVRPRLEAGQEPRVRPSLIGETTVALAVLLAAAILTNAAPPPEEPSAPVAVRSGG